jgi:hypothetical protein
LQEDGLSISPRRPTIVVTASVFNALGACA